MNKTLSMYLRAFIAGSAFPVVMWPFLYIGIPSYLNPGAGFTFELTAIFLPIILGSFNVLFVAVRKRLPFSAKGNYLLFGALYGLTFSLIGNFSIDIPRDLYLLTGFVQYLTIPFAIVAYALIWRYIIRRLNKLVGVEE